MNSAESLLAALFTCSKLRKVSLIKRQAACKYIFVSLHKLVARDVISVNTNLMRMFHQAILAKSKLWLISPKWLYLTVDMHISSYVAPRAVCANAWIVGFGTQSNFAKDNLRGTFMTCTFSSLWIIWNQQRLTRFWSSNRKLSRRSSMRVQVEHRGAEWEDYLAYADTWLRKEAGRRRFARGWASRWWVVCF